VQIEKYGALIRSPVTLPRHRQPQAGIMMRIATPPPGGGLFALLDDPPDEAAS